MTDASSLLGSLWALETTLERVWNLIKGGPPGLLALLFALAMFLTSLKLWRMMRLRGWLQGRQVALETVARKGRTSLPKETFWIETENGRLDIGEERWATLEVGQCLEIVTLPGESERYLKNDEALSNGQFLFDGLLLLGESAMFLWMLIRQ